MPLDPAIPDVPELPGTPLPDVPAEPLVPDVPALPEILNAPNPSFRTVVHPDIDSIGVVHGVYLNGILSDMVAFQPLTLSVPSSITGFILTSPTVEIFISM